MSGTTIPTISMGAVSNGKNSATPRTHSFQLTLTGGIPQTVDFRAAQNYNQMQDIQGVQIDNSQNASAFSLTTISGQNITCPPYGQGQSPLYMPPSTPVMTFTGAGIVNITLTNFSTPASFWSASTSTIPVTGGKAQVQDVALEAMIANGAFSSAPSLYGASDVIIHQRAGIAYSGVLTGAAATVVVIAGAPNAFVTSIKVWLDPESSFTGGEVITITAQFVTGGVVTAGHVYVGNLAPTTTQGPLLIISLDNLNLLGSLAGDTFEFVVTGTALTTGSLRYTVIGGTTGLV